MVIFVNLGAAARAIFFAPAVTHSFLIPPSTMSSDDTLPRSPSSILRPSGSFSSHHADATSVTVVSTEELPSYSVERFYMLSELQQHAGGGIHFLCDRNLAVPADESTVSTASTEQDMTTILYLLWRPDETNDPQAFADDIVRQALHHLDESPRCYLVVDRLVAVEGDDDVRTIESLARYLALTYREQCYGVTVGLSNHPRAAPGLEACLNAVLVGSRDRRRIGGSRSRLRIVACHPDDLTGRQEETDAVQGVRQWRLCAEWNGQGTLLTLAERLHSEWCREHNVQDPPSPRKVPKRIQRRQEGGDWDLPVVMVLVAMLVAVWRHVWAG